MTLPRALVAGGIAAAVLAPAAALAVVADRAGADAAAGEPSRFPAAEGPAAPDARVTTPLLSARRTPGTVSGRTPADAMVAELETIAAGLPPAACLAVDIGAVPALAHGPDPLIPASTLKVVTAAAALDVLGPDHRFRTTVQAAAPASDGRIEGDLWLVGGGDPVLATEGYAEARRQLGLQPQAPRTPLEDLADAVVAAGVTEVTGAVRGDETRYETPRVLPAWPPSYVDELQVAPLSALLVDDGAASLSPLRPSADPPRAAADALTRLLRARGVRVGGDATSGPAPAGAVEVAAVASAPLPEIVAGLLEYSDNTTAELLLLELGLTAGRGPTTDAGAAVVIDRLRSRAVPVDGAVVVDGSGLARGNRLPCRLLADLLATEPLDGPLVQGLAVAGETGTLADDFLGNPVEGRLRAKTGSLTDVRSLAGVWPPDGAAAVTFALVDNDPDAEARAAGLWDRLGRALATYPAPVDLTPFEPRPPG